MRKIIGAKPFANQTFKVTAGRVVKMSLVLKGTEVWCKDEISAEIAEKALIGGSVSVPNITLSLTEATEAELIAAKSLAPEQVDKIDVLLNFMKANEQPPQPAPPLRVEITNPDQLQRDTVLTVRRDAEGKLVSATAAKV